MLIFDFDGTIADSLPILIDCFNNNAQYYGYKTITNIEQLRNKEAGEIIKELELSLLKLPFVVNAVRNEMRAKMNHLKPFPEIAETITKLSKKTSLWGLLRAILKKTLCSFYRTIT